MSKQKILIADDSVAIRTMLSSVLERAGYDVAAAPDGQAALEMATDFSPGLVITDMNMPRLNGIELVKSLRSQNCFKFTPILVLTTESEQEKIRMGRAAGATGWMVKPFQPDRLLTVINKVFPKT